MPTFTCKLPPDLDARLTAASRARRTTKSEVVREILDAQLSRGPTRKQLSAYDVAKHVIGRLSGPRDLSRNPRHIEGFGE